MCQPALFGLASSTGSSILWKNNREPYSHACRTPCSLRSLFVAGRRLRNTSKDRRCEGWYGTVSRDRRYPATEHDRPHRGVCFSGPGFSRRSFLGQGRLSRSAWERRRRWGCRCAGRRAHPCWSRSARLRFTTRRAAECLPAQRDCRDCAVQRTHEAAHRKADRQVRRS